MILDKMLARLNAGLVSGPCLNARPHSSRQRVDLVRLDAFSSKSAPEILQGLLNSSAEVEIPAKIPIFSPPEGERSTWTSQQRLAEAKFKDQEALLLKIRQIVEDAADYENDHGESALSLGYPLLHIPPGPERSTRIIAPIAFISLSIEVRSSARKGITLKCNGDGIDRVVPNPALVAWIRQQTGTDLENSFPDEEGQQPWTEIAAIVKAVGEKLDLESIPEIGPDTQLTLVGKVDDLSNEASIIPGAVIGLFPLANQSLIADTRWMMEVPEAQLNKPVTSFLKPAVLEPGSQSSDSEAFETTPVKRIFSTERLISHADPCQAEAVRRAQTEPALVIHGPPGTGKSQTIANIIGDHVARGERVLFVCDKRTALDVVKSRLKSLGLDQLCALVHDPKREQRDLYMGLRERLDQLAEAPRVSDPANELKECDQNLETIHGELSHFHASLHGVNSEETEPFHSLFGRWLGLASASELPPVQGADKVTMSEVEGSQASLEEIFMRAHRTSYPQNPWQRRLKVSLSQYLQMDEADCERHLQQMVIQAKEVDETLCDHLPPLTTGPLEDQISDRINLANLLRKAASTWNPKVQSILQEVPFSSADEFVSRLAALKPDLELISSSKLDSACTQLVDLSASVEDLQARVLSIESFMPFADKWYRFLKFKQKKAAFIAISPLKLDLSPSALSRAIQHYKGLIARSRATEVMAAIFGADEATYSDNELKELDASLGAGLPVIRFITQQEGLRGLEATVRTWLAGAEYAQGLAQLMDRSAKRAQLLKEWENQAAAGGLLNDQSINDLSAAVRGNAVFFDYISALAARRGNLEDILRLETQFDALPPAVKSALPGLLQNLPTFMEASDALRKLALANELRGRIHKTPQLQELTSERVDALLNNYLRWTSRKRDFTNQHIRSYWQSKAKRGLLSNTQTQLNSRGAALRQRLLTRGRRALKLRKMIEVGQSIEGGDPLFDLCPIWMSSPNTVAQIFPKTALFDIVIFDEASQCRLEEALPVLLRARRVVVAGDPKQLPPTRFFESGIVESANEEIDSTDELFVTQQADTEDLLGAALNLSVRESYLDVHYRSTNAALIEFSNKNFYGGRLQAIPAHPNSLAEVSPVQLVQVAGIYKDRTNPTEAAKVVSIVEELLSRESPPSIGIACFNLTQRETILTALDEKAQADSLFAQRLNTARARQGPQSFEGLFVKNLENVQGDERDHMIISTTFGVNEEGRFHRRFGPLGGATGGRRLNVLVTRARDMIHVVTSIPRSEYMGANEIPAGSQPTGRYLLYEYLKYAEGLEEHFKTQAAEIEALAQKLEGKMVDYSSQYPSLAASAMGKRLHSTRGLGGFTHWGNDGFCVDVALSQPQKPLRVTIGVLSDFTRYGKAPDAVEWEAFRYFILRDVTKWKLIRTWSPSTFRALPNTEQAVIAAHDQELADN